LTFAEDDDMTALCRFPYAAPAIVLVLLLLVGAPAAAAHGFPGPERPARAFPVLMEEIQLADGTAADVYAPVIPRFLRRKFEDAFPVGVLLQGALVDKAFYSIYARTIAASGYVLVVPNRERVFGLAPPALLTDVHAVTDALDAMIVEDSDPGSPFHRVTDTATSFVIGHSFGGAVAIDAAAGFCDAPFFCDPARGEFVRPAGLRAAVIYGASQVDCDPDPPVSVADCTPLSRNTDGVAVALVQGTSDGIASPLKADATLPELEPPHALVQIPRATHFALCDVAQPPPPVRLEPNPSELDQEAAIALVAEETLDWLEMILATE
jgi:hypothetical protein